MHKMIINRLIEEIKLSGLTEKEVAKKMGVKRLSMKYYKTNNSLPKLDTFAKICRIIGSDTNYILGLTDI